MPYVSAQLEKSTRDDLVWDVCETNSLKGTTSQKRGKCVGNGWHFRFIPIHEVAAAVRPRKSATPQMLHALTGCDNASSFAGIGKKTGWSAWNMYP